MCNNHKYWFNLPYTKNNNDAVLDGGMTHTCDKTFINTNSIAQIYVPFNEHYI